MNVKLIVAKNREINAQQRTLKKDFKQTKTNKLQVNSRDHLQHFEMDSC